MSVSRLGELSSPAANKFVCFPVTCHQRFATSSVAHDGPHCRSRQRRGVVIRSRRGLACDLGLATGLLGRSVGHLVSVNVETAVNKVTELQTLWRRRPTTWVGAGRTIKHNASAFELRSRDRTTIRNVAALNVSRHLKTRWKMGKNTAKTLLPLTVAEDVDVAKRWWQVGDALISYLTCYCWGSAVSGGEKGDILRHIIEDDTNESLPYIQSLNVRLSQILSPPLIKDVSKYFKKSLLRWTSQNVTSPNFPGINGWTEPRVF